LKKMRQKMDRGIDSRKYPHRKDNTKIK